MSNVDILASKIHRSSQLMNTDTYVHMYMNASKDWVIFSITHDCTSACASLLYRNLNITIVSRFLKCTSVLSAY